MRAARPAAGTRAWWRPSPWRGERGQGVVECALIIGGISLVLLAGATIAFNPVGSAITGTAETIAAALGGGEDDGAGEDDRAGAQPTPASANDCKKGGWEAYDFPSQGACVSWYNANS